jgi:hypothetical protein
LRRRDAHEEQDGDGEEKACDIDDQDAKEADRWQEQASRRGRPDLGDGGADLHEAVGAPELVRGDEHRGDRGEGGLQEGVERGGDGHGEQHEPDREGIEPVQRHEQRRADAGARVPRDEDPAPIAAVGEDAREGRREDLGPHRGQGDEPIERHRARALEHRDAKAEARELAAQHGDRMGQPHEEKDVHAGRLSVWHGPRGFVGSRGRAP